MASEDAKPIFFKFNTQVNRYERKQDSTPAGSYNLLIFREVNQSLVLQ